MGRPPCSKEEGVKKGPWTTEEDKKLIEYIEKNGHGSWRALPKLAGLNRCGKSCRLRWTNYLRPDIKRGKFSEEEERLIIHLHSILGNKWSAIATNLPGRTDNEIKNYWNTHLRKQLLRMGIDPVTHRPRADLSLLANFPPISFASAADPLAGLELLLQGVLQALLAPSYLNNFDPRSSLHNRPEFQSSFSSGELESSVQRVQDLSGGDIRALSSYSRQIPALSGSPEIVTSELSQAMVNSVGDSAGASQAWRYSSDASSESDYCWEDILASIPTAL